MKPFGQRKCAPSGCDDVHDEMSRAIDNHRGRSRRGAPLFVEESRPFYAVLHGMSDPVGRKKPFRSRQARRCLAVPRIVGRRKQADIAAGEPVSSKDEDIGTVWSAQRRERI